MSIGTLYNFRDLLWMWTLREVRVRYKQSVLGAAWAVLQPLSLTLIFTIVFSYVVRMPSDGIPYPIFAYTALLPWTLFSTAISFAVPSLVNNSQLVTKIYFPREILPLGSILAALLDFMISAVVFVGMMVWYRLPLSGALLWIPYLLGVQVALIVGISLFAAGVNVYYRDIRFVVPLALQVWMYASPIIYPASLVPQWLRPLYALNPMVGIINGFRQAVLLQEAPLTSDLLIASCISVLVCALGYLYFKRVEPDFADVL